jgi:L-fuculose-phosphate aldolase
MNETTARAAIVRVARRLDDKGLLTSVDGNISVRLEDGALLITPSGSCKGELVETELVRVEVDGSWSGTRPSSEIALHRTIYRMRADVGAVVHAHPTHATAYAVAGLALDQPILSEAILTLGAVPVVPYAMPTAEELAVSVEPYVEEHDALLLRYHGAVCYAADVRRAGFLMETLEHVAQVDSIRRMLGAKELIPDEQVKRLKELRLRLMGKGGE